MRNITDYFINESIVSNIQSVCYDLNANQVEDCELLQALIKSVDDVCDKKTVSQIISMLKKHYRN